MTLDLRLGSVNRFRSPVGGSSAPRAGRSGSPPARRRSRAGPLRRSGRSARARMPGPSRCARGSTLPSSKPTTTQKGRVTCRPVGGDAGEDRVHLDVVREREDQLVHDLVLADRPRDRRDRRVLRPFADEVLPVEAADAVVAVAAGHRRDVEDVGSGDIVAIAASRSRVTNSAATWSSKTVARSWALLHVRYLLHPRQS